MAAYASLVSLMTLIEQIQNHPRPRITLHKQHVDSLCKNITFLQEFLESYSHCAIKEMADGLESRIADVAYAAADVTESHMADQIEGGAEIEHFYQDLQKVILNMDVVAKDAMEVKDKIGNPDYQLPVNLIGDGLKRSPFVGLKNAMVGFDDVFNEVLDKLIGDQSSCRIIPIVGMGGIGKTTLASNVYKSQLVALHFDVQSWVIISQNYNVREALLKILNEVDKTESRESLSQTSEEKLGEKLHKSLYGRRYLVVMDDMWNIEVWNEINRFFPDNNNGSRIMITSRLSSVASTLSKDKVVLNFLDDHISWNLLRNVVFGEEACPIELEESGRKIAKECKGLPLSITIMGGLLAKSTQTRQDWEFIAEKLNASMNLEHEELCLHILQTSFDHMPVHLKPCFLYMGIFPEDSEIRVSNLIKLWVAEGFVKPISGKSVELAGEEYLMDLIDRSLILVKAIGSTGKIKVCNIHDLTRDLCIREAEKESFLCIARKNSFCIQQSVRVQRRIAIHERTLKEEQEHLMQALDALQPASPVQSVACDIIDVFPRPPRMLRILNLTNRNSLDAKKSERHFEEILHSVNLRFLAFNPRLSLEFSFPSSIYLLWNLQTLVLNKDFLSPFHIWKMHQLKHVKVTRLCLPDPPVSGPDHDIVLENLQTLSYVFNFSFDEEVVKRIPNLRTLKIAYADGLARWGRNYHLCNLGHLQKLESFSCQFSLSSPKPSRSDRFQNIKFPHSLMKMELYCSAFRWEDITTEIGALPHLQVLKLKFGVHGREWNIGEGKFQRLRFLLILGTDLEYWTIESNQLPCLECLSLDNVLRLKEIPLDIGDAPNLQSIKLYFCNDSVVNSAQKILDEQEELGNGGLLKVRVYNFWAKGFVELRPHIEYREISYMRGAWSTLHGVDS